MFQGMDGACEVEEREWLETRKFWQEKYHVSEYENNYMKLSISTIRPFSLNF